MSSSEVTILRIWNTQREKRVDLVAKEAPISIKVNGKKVATLLATPTDLGELACGFLYSLGLVKGMDDISSFSETGSEIEITAELTKEFEPDEQVLTSGCGKGVIILSYLLGKIDSDLVISTEAITLLMDEFQLKSVGYKTTGGVHSAGISDGKRILVFKEDIGRHNAIDKAIGNLLLKRVSLKDKILLTSGRVTSEVVTKAVRAGIPILISRSSPTDMAITLSEYSGVTLIGFARKKRMNLYAHIERVLEGIGNW
ncbi:MAG: formate dehydrogenase accessory sulfurtransferase FdhD [Proteobacteria bacterium]|nr:formate dehydrogenase accessory sulfurtransferase FdhD [Pseudomonadota bacterium]